jgi:hypothetical protein
MPYITQDERQKFEKILESIDELENMSNGQMNYLISSIVLSQIKFRGECYDTYNSMVGVLESLKLELYRVYVATYENKKMRENGGLD